MPLPLIPIIGGAIAIPILYAIFGSKAPYNGDGDVKAGDIVDSGSTNNEHDIQFNYRIIYTLNKDAPYVANVLAGALLLTPGFFTDAVGFALLVPRLRRELITAVLRLGVIGRGGPPAPSAGPRRPLEGKYRRIDD